MILLHGIVRELMFPSFDLVTIFTTGLLAGGLSCVAVQGGLLTATLAQAEEERIKNQVKGSSIIAPILSFLLAKLAAYTIVGFFLGWLGSFFAFSPQARVILQLLVVVFMVGTALQLLNVHPVFRYFLIQPPRFISRLIRKQSKRNDMFAPVILGALTVLIPCGTTQAMMALAVASGNPVNGALILFIFTLGTSPVFFLAGYAVMKVGEILKARFMKIAAYAILILALFNLDTALALTGTQWTLRNTLNNLFCVVSYCDSIQAYSPVTEQAIRITSTGYSPNVFAVSVGSQVTLRLYNEGAVGCTQAFTMPALNIQKIVAPNKDETITFQAPDKPGRISFMCSMGMYPGTILVL